MASCRYEATGDFICNTRENFVNAPMWISSAANRSVGPEQVLLSNGDYYLKYQNDGNFVVYNKSNQAVWASGTFKAPGKAIFQTDGNLVLYDKNGAPYWSTSTWGNNSMVMNGNKVQIKNSQNKILWST